MRVYSRVTDVFVVMNMIDMVWMQTMFAGPLAVVIPCHGVEVGPGLQSMKQVSSFHNI